MVSMAHGVAAYVGTVHAHVHAVHAHGTREGYTLATNLGWCAILDIYFIHSLSKPTLQRRQSSLGLPRTHFMLVMIYLF